MWYYSNEWLKWAVNISLNFNLSGYVSSVKRTTLGVRNYKHLTMLSSIMQNIFIDVDWVVKEYISKTNNGQWTMEEGEHGGCFEMLKLGMCNWIWSIWESPSKWNHFWWLYQRGSGKDVIMVSKHPKRLNAYYINMNK